MKIQLIRALGRRADAELVDLHDLWIGGEPPVNRREIIAALRRRMLDPTAAASTRAGLNEAPARILHLLVSGLDDGATVGDLARETGLHQRSVRSALDELDRFGMAVNIEAYRGVRRNGKTTWTLPHELGAVLRDCARLPGDPRCLLTLHGFLDHHFRGTDADEGNKVRRMYRLLSAESAICSRVTALPEEMRAAVVAVITRHGGLASPKEFEALAGVRWDAPGLRKLLEDSSLGTLGDLDLEDFGIRQRGQVVAIFNEVVLAWLRQSAREDPVEPHEVAAIGVDLVSNFSRFTSFVGDQNVRFTVRGTIFKSTGKRISENLIPNPGREYKRREILDLLYRFALSYRLIDRTGERAFMLTREGQDFLREPLEKKQRRMLDWLVEDRELPGDMRHQLQLRRTTLRYLKRLETGVWYDAMFLPFVVRNHYVASLALEEGAGYDGKSFPVRSSADLQSMAWNLFTWIRKQLHLLGIIDMGYDKAGRACAIRLTTLGAQLLGMIPGRELEGAGHLVVNPDFEVVLFPDKYSHGLVYELDRFCERELTDSLYHYRITPQSLHRALAEGLDLDTIVALLQQRSRTPLPQNVLFSLESWARSDGMVTLEDDGLLVCDSPEILDRLQQHPEIERIVVGREDRGSLRLQTPVAEEQLESWIRDFGVAFRRAG